MTLTEIKQAIENGKTVHWSNPSYTVIKDKIGQYLIQHSNGHCIGLTWTDGVTMNGEPEDFFIAEPEQVADDEKKILKTALFYLPEIVPPIEGVLTTNSTIPAFTMENVKTIIPYINYAIDTDMMYENDGYYYFIDVDGMGNFLLCVDYYEEGTRMDRRFIEPTMIAGEAYYELTDSTGRYSAGWLESDAWRIYNGEIDKEAFYTLHKYAGQDIEIRCNYEVTDTGRSKEFKLEILDIEGEWIDEITFFGTESMEYAAMEINAYFPNVSSNI